MRLLVVEDDKALAANLIKDLSAAGFAVDHADNGDDAAFMGSEEPYDAAVLDLGLPGRSGLQVLADWRDAGSVLPPHEHGLFMKGEFKYYLFENLGPETVSANGKEFTAVKIVGRETKRDRAMHVWLVPELHNLPIKIEQWKEGKLRSTVLLERVSFDNNGGSKTFNLTEDPDDFQ